MRALLLLATLLLSPALAGAQCCGDCNDDGEVTINELITAVNNALNGCTVTDACPIDFSDDNTVPGTPDCFYRGRWNANCGDAALEALWRSDGEILIVQLLDFDEGIYFGAEVTGPDSAELFCWYLEEDASDCDANPVSGSVALPADGMLNLTPTAAPFSIDDCDFTRYRGAFVAVDTPAAAPRAAARAVDARALERLRGMVKSRAAQRDFRRR